MLKEPRLFRGARPMKTRMMLCAALLTLCACQTPAGAIQAQGQDALARARAIDTQCAVFPSLLDEITCLQNGVSALKADPPLTLAFLNATDAIADGYRAGKLPEDAARLHLMRVKRNGLLLAESRLQNSVAAQQALDAERQAIYSATLLAAGAAISSSAQQAPPTPRFTNCTSFGYRNRTTTCTQN